ncbi:hypothetical protein OAA03_00640 [bacterium]|nr:hypothetical protein [bacterium]
MAIDYTGIDEVVNDFQLMMDDTSYDKEAQIYQLRLLALQGLRELKFDAEQEVKTSAKTVTSGLQIALPTDFVKLLKIGYKNSADEFVSLGYKSDLSLDAAVQSVINDDYYDENNPYYHTDIGKKFGVGGGQNALGYYRINRQDGTINFSSDIAGKTVFMEYISDGIGSVQPIDHVIQLNFNSSGNSSGQIISDAILRVPSLNTSTSFTEFTLTTSIPNNSLEVQIGASDGASIIAEKFSNVINEGYPDLRIPPADIRRKASKSKDSNAVILTYRDLEIIPISISNSAFEINTSQTIKEDTGIKVLTSPIKLIQQCVTGSGPRVHKFCEEALRCYMYYKYIQRKRGIPANEKQMAKRAYYNEKRLARARMMNFNKEAAMQVSRKAFKQSPKI